MKLDNKLKPADVITRLLELKLQFSVRVYQNGDKLVCEIFAKNDWFSVAGSFPRSMFELDVDDRKSPIAKAVFIL